MAGFTTLTSKMVVLPENDIDTDQIIPARFLKVTSKAGLGEVLFNDWRRHPDGSPVESFVLNAPASQGRQVLLAGDNFGCGSSREHATWALTDWGFRAIISTSFADIFNGNALKNGLLPVKVDEATHAALVANPEAEVTIDLAAKTVSVPGTASASFDVDPFAQKCLLGGVDQLGYLLSFEDRIRAFEERR